MPVGVPSPCSVRPRGPAPSFVVPLYPVCLSINSPHLPKLNVAPIFCWDPDWYVEPRHFE